MPMGKKSNKLENSIQIRILKAIAMLNIFGPFKHFSRVVILRGLKQPNVLKPALIWKFIEEEYDVKRYEQEELKKIKETQCWFNDIFDE